MSNVYYKMPRARKVAEFTVYPFTITDRKIKLQSDNHCMIVDLDRNRTFISRRFNQYPAFWACNPAVQGSKVIKTPETILDQLNEILSLVS